MENAERSVVRIIQAQPTSDGAGVKLTRSLGTPALDYLDPFLLLDEFKSDAGTDYLAGFPDHPHRGFETVTYMLAGAMQHRDHKGNEGNLRPGSIQWMTAGRGIIHSEMPQQQGGLMWGFQLWVNLPAAEKMTAPRYQDIPPEEVPEVVLESGITIRVLVGESHGVPCISTCRCLRRGVVRFRSSVGIPHFATSSTVPVRSAHLDKSLPNNIWRSSLMVRLSRSKLLIRQCGFFCWRENRCASRLHAMDRL
jgi:redox-sensitive bicupin YhaK (pirin superfamily)